MQRALYYGSRVRKAFDIFSFLVFFHSRLVTEALALGSAIVIRPGLWPLRVSGLGKEEL